MTCERYWRDGILEVERGEHDSHRDGCADCRRAHQARDRIVRALPRVGAGATGAPDWQTQVWSRIARAETSRVRRSHRVGGGLAAACAVAVVCVFLTRRPAGDQLAQLAAEPQPRPRIEIVSGRLAMRSTSARVGDRVRIAVLPGGAVRLYRAGQLVLRCPAWRRAPGCAPDLLGLVADAELATAGDYQIALITSITAEPRGSLDRDLAAVVAAGGTYRTIDLSVR